MIDYGKRDILGVELDAVDLNAALERILYFGAQRRPYTVSALAVHGVIESRHDVTLADALNHFDLVLPDGQPVRWALNLLYGLDLPDKVPGPTVVDHLLERAASDGFGVYFYGSTPDTLAGIRTNLDRKFGGAIEVHSTPSRFGAVDRVELLEIAEAVNATGAQVCFVGLGCPRQERFVAALGPHLDMPSLAVGAAFDYIAGTISRSPAWVQRAGLEWAHRLAQDPRRLARRYLLTNSEFVAAVGRQLATSRLPGRHPTPTVTEAAAPPPVEGGLAAATAMWDLVDA